MDKDDGRRILRSSRQEQLEIADQIQLLVTRMEGLRSIIEGITKIFPDLDAEDMASEYQRLMAEADEEKPKGANAARTLLVDTPGKWFSVDMVVHDLDMRGWLPESENPPNAVRAALERLIAAEPANFHKDRGEKTGKVVYAYKPGQRTLSDANDEVRRRFRSEKAYADAMEDMAREGAAATEGAPDQ